MIASEQLAISDNTLKELGHTCKSKGSKEKTVEPSACRKGARAELSLFQDKLFPSFFFFFAHILNLTGVFSAAQLSAVLSGPPVLLRWVAARSCLRTGQSPVHAWCRIIALLVGYWLEVTPCPAKVSLLYSLQERDASHFIIHYYFPLTYHCSVETQLGKSFRNRVLSTPFHIGFQERL